MTKLEQMNELVKKVQADETLQKEIAAILQSTTAEDTVKADQWLTDNGYEFTLKELLEYLEEGIPLSEDQLEAVAGGKATAKQVFASAGNAILGFLEVIASAYFAGKACADGYYGK